MLNKLMRRSKDDLNNIADRLENELSAHKIYCRVIGIRSNNSGSSILLKLENETSLDKVLSAGNVIKTAMCGGEINIVQKGELVEILSVSGYAGRRSSQNRKKKEKEESE